MGELLDLRRDRPARNLTYGTNYTPIARMKRRRDKPRRTPIGVKLDLNKLFYMALTPEARAIVNALPLDQRLTLTIESMDALRATDYAHAKSVSLVQNGETNEVTVACEWVALPHPAPADTEGTE